MKMSSHKLEKYSLIESTNDFFKESHNCYRTDFRNIPQRIWKFSGLLISLTMQGRIRNFCGFNSCQLTISLVVFVGLLMDIFCFKRTNLKGI